MSTLKVFEFGAPSLGLPLRKWPPLALQTITVGTTSASTTFKPGTSIISVIADAPCSVGIGVNPTTAGTLFRIPAADQYFDFEVHGATHSIITSTSTG